jgi:uncharacterized membrane protein
MSEPESLNTEESLPRRIERHWFDRLIMLSDGVFAIAMTLLALEVRPPHIWSGDMLDLLAQTWRPLFGYGLSFVIVAMFWVSNRSIVARMHRVDGPYTALTILFLAFICLTPFATALVAEHGPTRAMKFYSLLVGSTGLIQAMLWGYAALVRGLVYAEVTRRERWLTFAGLLMLPFLFSMSGLAVGPDTNGMAVALMAVCALTMGIVRRRLVRPLR